MSKKNNKKSKNINRKNYKIESLEPRLMMDASANDWIHEVDAAFDLSATTSINSSTNAYKNWLNTNIQTLFVKDSVKGQRIAKVSDLIDNDQNALDWILFDDTSDTQDDLKEIMSSAINSLKSDYKNYCIQHDDTYKKLRDNSANAAEKVALLLKLDTQAQKYFNTKMISTSELLPLLNNSPKNTKYTFRQGADSDEIWVDILEGKHRTSTNGLSANVTGFSGVATNLMPFTVDNVDYARSYTLKLDGQGNVVLDNPTIGVASSFKQYTAQDVNNETDAAKKDELEELRNSNGRALEFKSVADDDDSAADYYMGLGLSAAGVHELVVGDLDFQVSESSKIAGLTSTGKLKYQYDNISRTWKWIGANDVENIEKASMGLILQKLSDLSLWLNQNSTVTSDNLIPLLYDSFAGTINQNATENAKLSALLDEILNTPPTSLQELYEKMHASSNRIVLNGNSLTLAFSLSLPAAKKENQNVSIAIEELTKLGFEVTRNESLSLNSTPKLDFTLNVDLSAQTRTDEGTYLKGAVAAIEYPEFFGRQSVSVDNPFVITGLLNVDDATTLNAAGFDNETGLSFFMDSSLSDAYQNAVFVRNIVPVAPSLKKYILAFTKTDTTVSTEEYLCSNLNELLSALQSSFAEKKMHIYYFSSLDHFVVVNENDCEYASFAISDGTTLFPFATINNVKIVENSPITVKAGDIVITPDKGSIVTVSVDASNHLDRESVAKQINTLLNGSDFRASFKNNRLVFENIGGNEKFEVSGSFFSNNGLFAGVTQKSSSSVCLTVTVQSKTTGADLSPIPIDLTSWFDSLSQSQKDSLKLVDILDEICVLSGNTIKRDGERLVGTDDFNLVEIKAVNGSLAAVLGLTGNADDGARFKLDALLLDALNSISYKKFDLNIDQKLSGKVDIDARVGLIEDHFYTEKNVDMGHKVELKYDDSKGLAQLPDANVLAIHQSVSKLTVDFENAYKSFSSCLNEVFDGSSIKIGSLASSFVNLLQSLDEFVNSTKNLKDCIETIWKNVDAKYGSKLSSFVAQKNGYLNNLQKILEDILDKKTSGYGSVLQAYISDPKTAVNQIVLLLQNLDDYKDSFDRIFANSISSYVNNIQSLFSQIASTIETDLGVSNWNVSKNALSGKTNAIIVKDSVTKGNNLGNFSLTNAASALNDTVQSLNSATSIAAALKWKKVALSENALEKWSGVELGGAMLEASSSFAQGILGFGADGLKPANAKSLFEKMDVLTQELPFIGKSIVDLCGFNAKMDEFRRVLSSADNFTLQGFATQLLDRIGMSVTNFAVEESVKDTIKVDFEWKYEVKNGTFVLNNLGNDDFHIGGALDVNLNVSLTFKIRMILEYDALASKKVKVSFVPVEEGGTEQKIIEAQASIEKSPLTGNLHVYYKVGGKSLQAPLVEIVDGSKISLAFNCGINLDTAKTFGLSIVNANVDAEGKINIRVAGQDAGYVEVGGNVDLKKDGVGKLIPSVSQNTAPNKSGLWVDASKIKLDFNFGSLYEQMRLVSDSLSQMLRRAVSGINKEVLRDSVRNIPFIGDRIVAAADCLTMLDEKFIEPFRNYVNAAQNLNAEMVALKLYNLLNYAGILGTLNDCSSIKDATTGTVGVTWGGKTFDKFYKGIQYCESSDEACWRIQIGGKYDLDPNADFDLGFPGLGLHSEGGLNISLEWSLDIGFGVSNNGAFLLLATDQDEVKISLNVAAKDNFEVDGSLGFMKMSLRPGTSTGFESGFGVKLNVDLNDQKTSSTVDVHNVGSGIAVKAKLAAALKNTWYLALSAGDWFPEIDADLYIDWSAATGAASNGLNELSFQNVTFKGGKFIDKTVMPVLKNIQKVIEPIQPLIKFLQSEIPVLNKLPAGKVHITVLDLIKMYGSGKDMDFGFIDDIIKINNLILSIKTGQSLELTLPDMELWKTPDKGLNDADADARRTANNASLDFLSGASKNIDAYVQKLRETFTIGSKQLPANYLQQLNDLRAELSDFDSSSSGSSSSTSLTTGGGRGWSFPILDNPLTEIAGLLFGRDATLVTYNMSPLKFNFDWKNSYPIVGPLCADIGFNFGVCIDLTFGYDTHGLTRWKDSGYKNLALLIDGFYVADWNDDGKDVAEVIFHSGVVAGASVCGRAGINVGLNFDVNLDFNDPNNDGKIRLGEMADMLRANPLLIFDASATIDVEAYAYLDYFVGRKKWTLWSSGAFELFNTASKATKDPIMESANGDYLVVNVGEFASGRNSGNLGDGDDVVTIVFTDARKGTISWQDPNKKYDFDLDKDPKNSLKGICVYAGLGKDVITIKSIVSVKADVIVYGGDGDDIIDASELTLADSFNAMLVGGLGIDRITGAAGGNNFIFGESGRYVLDDETKKKVLLAETLPVDGDVSGNVLTGGSGRNFVFGGEGGDVIYAGTGLNYLFGDRGRVEIDAEKGPVASRFDLFDEGNDDLIYGSEGDDHIYGGVGNDWIEGWAGNDEIYAGQGNDIVFGGNGTDAIHGGDGDDLIFGDTPFNQSMDVSGEGLGTSVLPYEYVSKEFKKINHPLYDESNKKIALTTPEERYIKALASYGAVLKQSSIPAVNSMDKIYGENGADIIFGDDGKNFKDLSDGQTLNGGNDIIEGGADNDFIDGDAGNDQITGGSGDDVIYGGQGNDQLDGGAGDDIVFGDDGLAGYLSSVDMSSNWFGQNDDANKLIFGETIKSFQTNFGVKYDAIARSEGGEDSIVAGNGSDIVDGQSGNDHYEVNFMGSYNKAYTNIIESGSDVSDTLTVNGTLEADDILVRRSDSNSIGSSSVKLGLVALLPDDKNASSANEPKSEKSQIERINFWNNRLNGGLEKMTINTGAGNDKISIDGTLTAIAVDAGAGNDTVNVGQMFKSEREANANTNIKNLDHFATTETTEGYLSNGVEHSTTIFGGSGNDVFNVAHTSAAIALSGGTGDDSFNISTFQKADADGNPDGVIQNAPVTLIGGAGNDTMSVSGTEADDTFVISEGSIQSSGVNVQAVSIENQNAYGGAGDDEFYVLDTAKDSVVQLNGNEGNDSFYNGGSQSDLSYIAVDNIDYKGHGGIIAHTVLSNTDKYKQNKTNSIAVNIRDNDVDTTETQTVLDILFTDKTGNVVSDPHAVVKEGNGLTTVYGIKLSKAPAENETVSVTVYAPEMTNENHQRGDRGTYLVNSDGAYVNSVTFNFTSKNYNVVQYVNMIAFSDNLREGDDHFALLHGVATGANTKVNPCRNVVLFLEDDRAAEKVISENPLTIDSKRNAFTETLSHTINAVEAGERKAIVGLRSSAEVQDAFAWYQGMPDGVKLECTWNNSQNALTIKWDASMVIPEGSVLFVNYTARSMELDNTSTVNLKYEAKESDIGWMVLGTDYSFSPMTKYDSSLTGDNNGITYEIVDTDNSLLVYKDGQLLGANESGYVMAWIDQPVVVQNDCIVIDSGIYGLDGLSVTDVSNNSYNLFYTDLYAPIDGYYFTQTGNLLKIYQKKDTGPEDVTSNFVGGKLQYRVAYWVGGKSGKIVPNYNATVVNDGSEKYALKFFAGNEYVIYNQRQKNADGSYSENGYFFRIEGSQVIVCSNKTGLPVTISGCLSIERRTSMNVADETYAWESSSAEDLSKLGSGNAEAGVVGKVVITQTSGSTDVEEGGYTDTYAISLNGENLVGKETVKVEIDPVSTPFFKVGDEQTPENLKKDQQVKIESISYIEGDKSTPVYTASATTSTQNSKITIEFNKDRCKGYFLVTVMAIDDKIAESDNPTLVPVGERTIENILGAVFENGAGDKPESSSGNPSMLRYLVPTDEISDEKAEKNIAENEDGTNAEEQTVDNVDDFDESKSVDRVFVNNMDNLYDATSSTRALSSSKTRVASANNPKLIDAEKALIASDSQSVRFTHTDKSHKDAKDNFAKNISFGNMEYGEINLGTGEDTVNINKSIYREDGFQTFTVVNSGKGGDTINVNSYKAEEETLVCNISKQFAITAKVDDKYTYVLTAKNGGVNVLPFNVEAIGGKDGKVYLVVVFSDGVERRAEVDVAKTTVNSIALLHAFDGVTDELKVVSARFAMFKGSDDQLVINAGEDDDKILATDTQKVTKSGLIAFGGLGNDKIEIKSDSSLVFGDRGQVLYYDQNGNVITRLGDDGTGASKKQNDGSYAVSADGSDYATGKNKGDEAYYQTDGVRYGASIARTVTEAKGGNDTVSLANGRNVVFGGVNNDAAVDKDGKPIVETIKTGRNEDLVFGDNGYTTFQGRSDVAKGLGMENMPTIYSEATLSFNFQGPAQNGIGANEKAGTDDYAIRTLNKETNRVEEATEHAGLHVGNWNNIKGHEAGTYGDNDDEIVLFDNGSRASAVSVTYGASEDHRVNTTDGDQIRLHGYTQEGRFYASNSGDYNLMKSGLDTSGNNARNVLLTQVDGLNQYFTDYDVVVYLDMVRENSWAHDSVRVVTLYRDYVENGVARSEWVESYYVNDPEDNSFNGKWVVATATSAKDAKKRDKNGYLVEQANCVIFKNISGDRFHVEITDGDGENGYNNGKDRAGIAGIQVKGRLHKQDVAASTDIVHGGNDNINTQGGDDVVVGGTGADKIRTFGDDRYGIYDNDVVYGDNAKMVFTDRDSNLNTASTISYAESIASKNLSVSYDDKIMSGNGNDVVVGGSGSDKIDTGATAQADEKLDGLEVFSLNFTDVSSNQSTLISKGESAGVVADNDWHNGYLYNGQSRVHEVDRNNDEDTEKALQKITFQYDCYGNTSAPTEVTNASMDADTGNNKMMMNYVGGHNQDSLTVRLNNIPEKFTANKYDVYVYIDGINNDSDAHGYVFKITGSNGKAYYLNDWSGNRFDGEFKEVTCTEYNRDMFKDGITPSVEMIGNYVVFRDVETKHFSVTIECFETTYGTQRRNDLPVISAVQLVAGANRKADIAVGGDHDKDFVVGDDATLHFDLDIPFAGDESIGDYQNRLVSAKSTSVSGSANSDKIWTGKDRDVVIGGEGNDQIDAGAGDDVVIGNTVKSVYVEHNNPVGVFRPNVNIVLEDNDYNVAEPRPYLDGQGGNKDQIRSMVQGGQIEGIKLDNQNTGYDTVYGGNNNKDLVFINGHTEWGNLAKEMTSDSFFGVQKDDVHALPTPPAPAEVDPVSGGEDPVNGGENPVTGNEDPVNGNDDPVNGNDDPVNGDEPQNEVDYTRMVISPAAIADLTLVENEKVKLVFETYPQFSDHIANLHLYFTGKNGKLFEDVTIELYSHGKLYRYDVQGNYWVGVDVQDHIDGDPDQRDGNCVLYVISKKATAFTLAIGE